MSSFSLPSAEHLRRRCRGISVLVVEAPMAHQNASRASPK
jgi:hypothetical protein